MLQIFKKNVEIVVEMESFEGETSIPLIIQFRENFQTLRLHTHIMLDSQHLDLIPVLAGTSTWWNNEKIPKRYIVDLCPIQKLESFLLDMNDVKFSLRIMKNCVLYGNQQADLDQANYNVYQEFYNTFMINWVNVFRVLHFIVPSRADCFKNVLILDTKEVCRVNCFRTNTKITHKKLLIYLKRFLLDYFQPFISDDALSIAVKNRVAAWKILSEDFPNLFKREIFNINGLNVSDRCHSLIKEVMLVNNREGAKELYESFKRRN